MLLAAHDPSSDPAAPDATAQRRAAFGVRMVVVAVCAGAFAPCLGGCEAPEAHAAQAPVFPVTHPVRKDVDIEKQYVAQIRAIQHIEMRALERGYLQDIYVDEGQHVKADKKMFQVMPMIYQAEVAKAKAEVDRAHIEFANTKLLSDKDIVSQTELGLAKAKLDHAKAELSLAQTHKRLAEIHAPFDGIMGRFRVRKGSLVEEGELLTTLSDVSRVWVYFNVTEAEYLDYKLELSEGAREKVELRMANGRTFDQPGEIETIEADFSNETGNIAFRATFSNPDGLLRHGETGTIVRTTSLRDTLVIPQKATYAILDRRFVFVVDDDGVAHSREITIAGELPHVYLVGGGLETEEAILLDGLRKVRDGMSIETEQLDPGDVLTTLDVPAE